MAQTWINGFFFEYDDTPKNSGGVKGIQYSVHTDLAEEPISVEFFKAHAKIDFDMDDNLALSYVKAARQELERYCQLSFGDKVMQLKAKELPTEYHLMFGPVKDILLPDDTYTLLGDIITSEKPQNDVTVRYNVGWGSIGLPESVRIAIAQTATGMYYHRENVRIDYATIINQAKQSLDRFKNGYFI